MRALHAGAALTVALALLGCRGGAAQGPGGGAGVDAHLTLYRDGALVEERLEVALDDAGHGSAPFTALGVEDGSLEVLGVDRPLTSWSLRGPRAGDAVIAHVGATRVPGTQLGTSGDGLAIATADGVLVVARAQVEQAAPRLELTAGGRGRVQIAVRYRTAALTWSASYLLLDDGRGHGRLHGALQLTNATARQWNRATLAVIDAPAPAFTRAAAPRHVLRVDSAARIGGGEQRLDLGIATRALPLTTELSYDPVGDELDGGTRANLDPTLGVQRWTSRVATAISLDLGRLGDRALPAGAIQLFSQGDGGVVTWRGEGELLPPATDAERTLTITLDRSDDVTARRQRTMFEVENERERLVEEFKLTFTNRGDRAHRVVAREHLYRGKCWSLVYYSTPEVAKEGEQQVSLRAEVPARGEVSIVYRVAYKWSADECEP